MSDKDTYTQERIDGIADEVAAHAARLDAQERLIETKVSIDKFQPVLLMVQGLAGSVGAVVLNAILQMLKLKQDCCYEPERKDLWSVEDAG